MPNAWGETSLKKLAEAANKPALCEEAEKMRQIALELLAFIDRHLEDEYCRLDRLLPHLEHESNVQGRTFAVKEEVRRTATSLRNERAQITNGESNGRMR